MTTDHRAVFAAPALRGPDLLLDVGIFNRTALASTGHALGQFAGAGVVGAVVSLAVQWLLGTWNVPMPSFGPMALSSVLVGILVLAVFTVSVRCRFGFLTHLMSWAAISALTTSALSLMLFGTRFYFAGITGDQLFRVQYVTRLTDEAGDADFAYPDLPGYYPRGWFWLAGRFANLLGWPGWLAYKPFAILSMAVGSVLAYVIWCQVIRPAHALLVTLAASTVAIATWAAYEPYAWVFGALIPPLAVIAWRYLVIYSQLSIQPGLRHKWTAPVLLGGTLGLLALFYTLLFVFMSFMLVLIAIAGLVLTRRAEISLKAAVSRSLARLAFIGVLALPFTLVQWVPYQSTFVRDPVDQTGALRYFPQTASQFPLFHYPVDFAGLISLLGFIWCIVRLRERIVAKGLLAVVGAGYVWYAMSMAGVLIDLTLLPFKVEIVMTEALRCAGVLGLLDGAGWLYRRLARPLQSTALAAVAALSLLGVVGEIQSAPVKLSELVSPAYTSYYPTGYTPIGERDPTQPGAWNQQLHDTIAELTGEPEHSLVVLSTYQDFLSFWPYWSFQTTVLEYANPLARFDARRNTVENWARSPSSATLLAALRGSSFRPPDVFVFTRQSDGLHLRVTRNVFPLARDNEAYDIVFPARLFDLQNFVQQDVGPFTVIFVR